MSAERWYLGLLRAYPASFRAEYEREMLLAFRQWRRDGAEQAVRFWAELVLDVARSAPALRWEALRARQETDVHLAEGTMKTMAIVATLVGVVEIINSLIEGVAGGVHRDGLQLLSVALGIIGGVVLVAAGIAMLRRGARARPHALGAAAACLVAFAVIGLAAPVMSGLAMLLGIGFPVVLLAYLLWQRGHDSGVPRVA